MMKIRLTLALILCVLVVAGWTLARPASQAWEYKIVYLKDSNRPEKSQDAIAALGSEGWELVSVERESVNGTSYDGAAFYFKRQK